MMFCVVYFPHFNGSNDISVRKKKYNKGISLSHAAYLVPPLSPLWKTTNW